MMAFLWMSLLGSALASGSTAGSVLVESELSIKIKGSQDRNRGTAVLVPAKVKFYNISDGHSETYVRVINGSGSAKPSKLEIFSVICVGRSLSMFRHARVDLGNDVEFRTSATVASGSVMRILLSRLLPDLWLSTFQDGLGETIQVTKPDYFCTDEYRGLAKKWNISELGKGTPTGVVQYKYNVASGRLTMDWDTGRASAAFPSRPSDEVTGSVAR